MKRDPIVISGGGPVGLVAALALAKRGLDVCVLEIESQIPTDLRAGTFHPPTVEMLAELGVGAELVAAGIPVPEWQIRDRRAGVIARFDLAAIADLTPYPFRLHCEQHKLSSILYRILGAMPNVTLLFGHRCTAVEQDDDGVTVRFQAPDGDGAIRASYVIGADGAHSAVRKSLGVEFEGFTWPERFLVFATDYDLREQGFTGNAYIADPDEWVAIFIQPHDGPPGIWRMAFPIPPELDDADVLADDYVQSRIKGFLSSDQDYPILYRSVYRVHQRVASRFRVGRAMLVGDAAHINNPLGGMGLNSGIHDAINLTGKLCDVMLNGAPDSLLDLYDRQRRQTNIEYVQAITIRNKRLLEEKDPAVRTERLDEMRTIAADPVSARQYLMNSSMIASIRRAAEIV
ncbi:Para-nitrophenol 4-monooxygenase [Paraburkholderia hiiakae]|uniref:Para-nitrophenol 4-monooxygenase n=1 Tax=Paraburkholderia hiiakae TaxID=1081782 RepID=A0ABN7IJ78_9BURK|nr:FAD-dependent monooxygenase [Paraburkholderia hiiakae]CAD6559421.1 Para-nitrophenol 4-monooxygenase [Paraburkholderia hiiakae]